MNITTVSDGYEYMHEEFIGECSKCTICTKPLVDPVSTRCEPKPHIFCRSCIEKQLGRSSSCSLCCQELHTEDLISVTDNDLLDSLDRIPVKCVHCQKTGLERGKFNHHKIETYPKTNVSCQASDIKCPWIGPREQLEQHLNTCPFNILRPIITQLQNEYQRLTNQVNDQRAHIERLVKEKQQSEKRLQLFESMYRESLLCSTADNRTSRWKRTSFCIKSLISKKRKRDEHQ